MVSRPERCPVLIPKKKARRNKWAEKKTEEATNARMMLAINVTFFCLVLLKGHHQPTNNLGRQTSPLGRPPYRFATGFESLSRASRSFLLVSSNSRVRSAASASVSGSALP